MRLHLLKIRLFLPPPWFVASGDMSTYDFYTKLPTFPPRSKKFDDVGGMLGELFPNKPFAQAGVGAPPGVCPCSERHPDAVRLCFVDRLCDAIAEEAQGYSTRSSSESSTLGQVYRKVHQAGPEADQGLYGAPASMLPCSAAACSPRLPRPLAVQTHPPFPCRINTSPIPVPHSAGTRRRPGLGGRCRRGLRFRVGGDGSCAASAAARCGVVR